MEAIFRLHEISHGERSIWIHVECATAHAWEVRSPFVKNGKTSNMRIAGIGGTA